MRAAGRDSSEADRLIRPGTGFRQAQAIDDLIAYEEALGIYSGLVASGRKDLEADLARLCIDKALVHRGAGDVPGQVGNARSCAIESYQRLVHEEGRQELAEDLAYCHMNKAIAVSALGDYQAAVAFFTTRQSRSTRVSGIRERASGAGQVSRLLLHEQGHRHLGAGRQPTGDGTL